MLTLWSVKYTAQGSISVRCKAFEEPTGLRDTGDLAVEIVVADTGCGIPNDKLESIFREFEQVETAPRAHSPGLGTWSFCLFHGHLPDDAPGLGLAVVARIVEQLGGQLRVDSNLGQGSRFSFLLPLTTDVHRNSVSRSSGSSRSSLVLTQHGGSRGSELNDLVDTLSVSHMDDSVALPRPSNDRTSTGRSSTGSAGGHVEIQDSGIPLRPVKVDEFSLDRPVPQPMSSVSSQARKSRSSPAKRSPIGRAQSESLPKLRILIVEVGAPGVL